MNASYYQSKEARCACEALINLPISHFVFAVADSIGAEARLVGGSVRDALAMWSSQNPPDLDFAVNRPICEFADALREAGGIVYETGVAHGTITLRVGQHIAEITQLRIDMNPDGRHADIQFITDWQRDAERRDFTINALYLDAKGQLCDPMGGVDDLARNRLRFIGHVPHRLAEDYLRLLRALRFLSVYPELSLDEDCFGALSEAVPHLTQLSAERISSEFRKLLSGRASAYVLGIVTELGIDTSLFGVEMRYPFAGFLPSCNQPSFEKLKDVFARLEFPEQLALCADEMMKTRLLGLSRSERRRYQRMMTEYDPDTAVILGAKHWRRSAYRMFDIRQFAYLRAVADGTVTFSEHRLRQIVNFSPPSCPVNGQDIHTIYKVSGAEIGLKLNAVTQRWIDSDFTLTKIELLT